MADDLAPFTGPGWPTVPPEALDHLRALLTSLRVGLLAWERVEISVSGPGWSRATIAFPTGTVSTPSSLADVRDLWVDLMALWAEIADEGTYEARRSGGNKEELHLGAGLHPGTLGTFGEKLAAFARFLPALPRHVPPRFCVLSTARHATRWRALRTCGLPIASTWPDRVVGERRHEDCLDVAPEGWLEELRDASGCLVYTSDGELLRGSLTAIGAALSLPRPVIWVDIVRGHGVEPLAARHPVAAHPGVQVVATLDEALELLGARQAAPAGQGEADR
jgi:hypothetical protein